MIIFMARIKSSVRHTLFALLVVVLLAVAAFIFIESFQRTDPGAAPLRSVKELTILHTNDIHGQVVPSDVEWPSAFPDGQAGGMASLGTFLNQERATADREDRTVLYMDAGDWFTGTPEDDLLEGKLTILGFNETGLNYTTLGNHEFDVDTTVLKSRLEELQAPVISSNVRYGDANTPFPGTRKWKVVKYDDIEIGLFGLVELSYIPELPGLGEVFFIDETEAAREAVEQLKEQDVDLIVGITHLGVDPDRQLARNVDGIDIIVGGHSHTRLEEPERVRDTLILQAGNDLTSIGRLDLKLDAESNQILEYRGGLVTLYHELYPPDPEVEEALAPYIEEVGPEVAEVVATTTASIERPPGPGSPLGNLVTDAMREAVDADIAFQNSFGIRDNLPEGEITRGDIYSVLPFRNYLVEMTLTGAQIENILESEVASPDVVMQLSGLEVETESLSPSQANLIDVKVNEEPLEAGREYSVVTSNFLAETRSEFQAVENSFIRHEDLLLWQLLENHLRELSPVEPPLENRYPGLEDFIDGDVPKDEYTRRSLRLLPAA